MYQAKSLTNLQLELLQMFQLELENEQLQEIKLLLVNYFANKLSDEMDILFEENAWGEEKIEAWSNEHMRTKYEDR